MPALAPNHRQQLNRMEQTVALSHRQRPDRVTLSLQVEPAFESGQQLDRMTAIQVVERGRPGHHDLPIVERVLKSVHAVDQARLGHPDELAVEPKQQIGWVTSAQQMS